MAKIDNYSARTGRELKEDSNAVNLADIQEAMAGQNTGKRINTTDVVTPSEGKVFVAIKALADTTIDEAVGNISNFDGAEILAGDAVPGRWTSITIVAGGDCIAYEMGV